jgi:hypothetical protein
MPIFLVLPPFFTFTSPCCFSSSPLFSDDEIFTLKFPSFDSSPPSPLNLPITPSSSSLKIINANEEEEEEEEDDDMQNSSPPTVLQKLETKTLTLSYTRFCSSVTILTKREWRVEEEFFDIEEEDERAGRAEEEEEVTEGEVEVTEGLRLDEEEEEEKDEAPTEVCRREGIMEGLDDAEKNGSEDVR